MPVHWELRWRALICADTARITVTRQSLPSVREDGWYPLKICGFFEMLEQRFPEVPHYMLGFSLGSFLIREYLTKYPGEGEIAGVIIMGTGHQPGGVAFCYDGNREWTDQKGRF